MSTSPASEYLANRLRCAHCQTQTMGDPDAFYNKRIGAWLCGICHQNAKDKLMAYLRRNQEQS